MTYKTTRRDRVVDALCLFLVSHVATPTYRKFYNTVYNLGIAEFDKRASILKKAGKL